MVWLTLVSDSRALSFKEDRLRAQSGEQRLYLREGGSGENSWRRDIGAGAVKDEQEFFT